MVIRLLRDLREMFAEQREYRELLYQLTIRDLRLRYKQTVMGFGWAIFMPLINTAVFSVIFTRVAPIDAGIPYPLFAYSGLLAWNFLASSLRFAVNSLTTNSLLVTKVYFPREVLPTSAVLVALFDSLVASVILVAFIVYYGVPLQHTAVVIPLVMVVHLAFTTAMCLLAAMANLFYRDVKYVFEIVITIWMFGTSVLYPVANVEGFLGAVMRYNPMTIIIDAYRAALFFGEWPSPALFALMGAISLCLFVASWVIFHRAEFRFAESI